MNYEKIKVKKNMNLGEAIREIKTLSQGIDEYHIVNPNSSTVTRLASIVRIARDINVPTLMGEMNN